MSHCRSRFVIPSSPCRVTEDAVLRRDSKALQKGPQPREFRGASSPPRPPRNVLSTMLLSERPRTPPLAADTDELVSSLWAVDGSRTNPSAAQLSGAAHLPRCAIAPRCRKGPEDMLRRLRSAARDAEKIIENSATVEEQHDDGTSRHLTPSPIVALEDALDGMIAVPTCRLQAVIDHLVEVSRRRRKLLDAERATALNTAASRMPVLTDQFTFDDFAAVRLQFDSMLGDGGKTVALRLMPPTGWIFKDRVLSKSLARKLRKNRLALKDVLRLLYATMDPARFDELFEEYSLKFNTLVQQQHLQMVTERLSAEELMYWSIVFAKQDVDCTGFITASQFRSMITPLCDFVSEDDVDRTFVAYSHEGLDGRKMDFEEFVAAMNGDGAPLNPFT